MSLASHNLNKRARHALMLEAHIQRLGLQDPNKYHEPTHSFSLKNLKPTNS
jgi:hypothetical protein